MRLIFLLTVVAALLLSFTAFARAEVKPAEVGLIAVARSEPSRQLAEHYCRARGVPAAHVFLLNAEANKPMSRAAWQQQTRPALRKWLQEKGPDKKIRCLITCFDVPLRIEKLADDAPEVGAREDFFARARADLVRQFAGQIKTLDAIARASGEKPPERAPLQADADAKQLTSQFQAALEAARARLETVKAEEQKKQSLAELQRVFVFVGGLNALARAAVPQPGTTYADPRTAQQLELIKGQIGGLGEGLRAMRTLPECVGRDQQALSLAQKIGGLLGAVQWIEQEQQQLKKNETQASFDSELSLLNWPDYALSQWQPNWLCYRYGAPPAGAAPTLMVARLEAPTLELAKKLVDTAIATEKTGLKGKVYIDARGIAFDGKRERADSYGAYDQSLRDLAERLKEHTKLEVVLDNKAELFQADACPEAAVYCGWYSLAKYVDAFHWQPGAVGYHIASSEATTLRTPGSKVWCNAMLEDGVCATLGPAFEPYLGAFPLPDDFFPLLLTGRYSLVETYYRTCPAVSWAMVLVGDPLYNPFKNAPQLAEEALPERMRRPAEGGQE